MYWFKLLSRCQSIQHIIIIMKHKAIRPHIMGPAHTWITIDFRRVASYAWLSAPIKVDEHSGIISNKDVGSPEITKHQLVWMNDINRILYIVAQWGDPMVAWDRCSPSLSWTICHSAHYHQCWSSAVSGLDLEQPTSDVHPHCIVLLNKLDNDWAIRHVIECCRVQESVFVFRSKARRVWELDLVHIR